MSIPDFVAQGETNECGLACISMLAQTQNIDLPLEMLRDTHPASSHGMSLAELCSILNNNGIPAYPVLFEHHDLHALPLPAILHYGSSHYVLLVKQKGDHVCLMNPAIGQQIIPTPALKKEISGYALVLDLENKDKAPLTTPVRKNKGMFSFLNMSETAKIKSVYSLMLISFLVSLTLFIMPGMVGSAINNAFSSRNSAEFHWQYYVLAFVCGTLLALAVRILTEKIIKRFMLVKTAAGFHQLLNNKQHFFDKRAPGEVYSRFNSWQMALIQKLELDNRLRTDWIIALLSLAAMYFINPLLALVSGIGITLTGAISVWALFKDSDYTQQIEVQAAEQNDFVFETLQGISTIKAAGLESIRQNGFAHHASALFNVLQRQKVYLQIKDGLYQLVGSLEMIVFMLVALPLVASGSISLGNFFAYSFIRQIFTGYVTQIFYGIIQKKHIHVIDQRAADLFTDAGANPQLSPSAPVTLTSVVEWQAVSYGYSPHKEIIPPTKFQLLAQETVAILGESGAGKSTFLRLLAGLLEARSGQIVVDGQTVDQRQLRGLVFLQSQEDILFNCSVLQNITLFDTRNQERMHATVTRIVAGLRLEEVLSGLPGGLNALIRESHCGLSQGQRQRLLLARALYSSRDVILLDEPTANLDDVTVTDVMQWVIDYCKDTGKTLVVVTHNQGIAPLFDRIYRMNAGALSSDSDSAAEP